MIESCLLLYDGCPFNESSEENSEDSQGVIGILQEIAKELFDFANVFSQNFHKILLINQHLKLVWVHLIEHQ